MEEIKKLEMELILMLDNIKRLKQFVKDSKEPDTYRVSNARVVGELKHRSVALKQRLTLVSKVTTRNIV